MSGSTNKLYNCAFEGNYGNRVMVCAIKPIAIGKELLTDYNPNRINETCNCVSQLLFVIY